MSVYVEIRSSILQREPGSPISPRDLCHLGRRGTVDNALSRLVKERVVKRISRGLYVREYPGAARISGDAIATAAAQAEGAKIQIPGAEAVYRLGLSADRPADCVYLTTGRSRRIKVGNQAVELRHDGSPAMLGAGTQAGMVISALRHLGEDGITAYVVACRHSIRHSCVKGRRQRV